ncbi:anticodon-binding domain-containing protein [Tribonema minus]|uniref:Anticodon-binding domain-containing protein n=1 Tax=Tribonema minus TaxID=303371 RepID=A0A835ZQ15_9STRA|nr:anticodon-binding domain-containing protein [Tribonema minus]
MVAIAAAKVGDRVKVTLSSGEIIEGLVYTEDRMTNMLVLQCSGAAASGAGAAATCSMRMLSREHIIALLVVQAQAWDWTGDDAATFSVAKLPTVTPKELHKKEEKALREAERAMAQLNARATLEGQALCFALSKTMDCEWDNVSLIVFDQVRVDPPYTANDCKMLPGCPPAALERIQKVLEGERRKMHQAAAATAVSTTAAAGSSQGDSSPPVVLSANGTPAPSTSHDDLQAKPAP